MDSGSLSANYALHYSSDSDSLSQELDMTPVKNAEQKKENTNTRNVDNPSFVVSNSSSSFTIDEVNIAPSTSAVSTKRKANSDDRCPRPKLKKASQESKESKTNEPRDSMVHSVHRICSATVKLKMGKKATDEVSESAIIKNIIDLANNKQHGETKYKRILGKEPEQPLTINEFDLEVYSCKIVNIDPLLFGLNIGTEDENTTSINNTIAFFYKEGDIYTSTTRNAWHVIQWCSDHDFPIKIANRLLSEEGPIKQVKQPMTGISRLITECKKAVDGSNPRDPLTLITKFTADLRKDCSIYGLTEVDCFKRNGTGSFNANIKVECGVGFVKIQTKIMPSQLPFILEHYSTIIKKEGQNKTFLSGPDRIEEKSTSVYDKELDLVPHAPIVQLDSHLLTIIKDEMNIIKNSTQPKPNDSDQSNSEQKSLLQNFDLCHTHKEDYTIASKIVLHEGKEMIQEFSPNATVYTIINYIYKRDTTIVSLSDVEFRKKFQNFKISFQFMGKETKKENILNYIEGEFIFENRVYWRTNSKWWVIKNMVLVQQNFQQGLSDNLILLPKDQENFNLTREWTQRNKNMADEELKNYLQSYAQNDMDIANGFFIFDETFISNVKLKTINGSVPLTLNVMLKILYNGQIVVYFVQNGFQAIRNVSVRIQIALNEISRSTDGTKNDSSRADLENNYKTFCQAYVTLGFLKLFPEFSNFTEKLKKSTVVFALVDLQNRNGRSLIKEKDLAQKMNLDKLEDHLSNNIDMNNKTFSELKMQLNDFLLNETEVELPDAERARKLYDELKNAGLFQDSEVITNKMLMATEPEFKNICFSFVGKTALQNFMYTFVKEEYQTQYHSILPKLEIIEIIKIVTTNTNFKFKICEIPIST